MLTRRFACQTCAFLREDVIPATGRIKAEIARLLGTSRQAFTPDRSAYLPAIFYGAAGALVAALITELLIRAWRLYARREGRVALLGHLWAFPPRLNRSGWPSRLAIK
jgi:hypothetical protein